MNLSTLRLFNAIKVEDKNTNNVRSKSTLKRTLSRGYILHPAIQDNPQTLKEIETIIGISGERANAAFHKSWKIVQESSIEELVAQQILHYITTYGFEELGVFHQSTVYIPYEKLNIPKLKDGISLTFVNALTSEEIKNQLMRLVKSGVALSKQTVEDAMTIIKAEKYDSSILGSVKNHELQSLLFDHFNLVPFEPLAWLRYVIAKLTGDSLLIKNDFLIKKIKESNSTLLDSLLAVESPSNLSSIFFRFKPLFLALKSLSKNNKRFFNRLRKDANKMHEPLDPDYMNSVTGQLKQNKLSMGKLAARLKSVPIFRKIRLAQALSYRLCSPGSIVYHVRNGRGWASDFHWENKSGASEALDIVLDSIARDIAPKVMGKVFYIPDYIKYALPASEKKFMGNFPMGTCVSLEKDMVAGVNWRNTNTGRVDLDLSLMSDNGKIGWDSFYRSEENDILFSGDVTDAPGENGASELFYFKKSFKNAYVIMLNYFNQEENSSAVPCKVFLAKEECRNLSKNYMVNQNNIVASANIEITQRQTTIGFVTRQAEHSNFYFAAVSTGKSITARAGQNTDNVMEYMVSQAQSLPYLNDLLVKAGAIVVGTVPTEGEYCDFSPQAITKTSILDLFQETNDDLS